MRAMSAFALETVFLSYFDTFMTAVKLYTRGYFVEASKFCSY